MSDTVIFYSEGTGRIGWTMPYKQGQEVLAPPGMKYVVADCPANIDSTHYVKSKKLVPYPPRPSEWHIFDFDTKTWELDSEMAWTAVRSRRDQMLSASDWRVTKAMEAGEPQDPAWAAYRQALRDITDQADPTSIAWPQPPENTAVAPIVRAML